MVCSRDIPLPQDVVSSTQHTMNASDHARSTDQTVTQANPEPKEQPQNAAPMVDSVHRLQIESQVEPLTGSNERPIMHCQCSPPNGRSNDGTDSPHTRTELTLGNLPRYRRPSPPSLPRSPRNPGQFQRSPLHQDKPPFVTSFVLSLQRQPPYAMPKQMPTTFHAR